MLLFLIHTIISAYAYQQHWNKQKEKRGCTNIQYELELSGSSKLRLVSFRQFMAKVVVEQK